MLPRPGRRRPARVGRPSRGPRRADRRDLPVAGPAPTTSASTRRSARSATSCDLGRQREPRSSQAPSRSIPTDHDAGTRQAVFYEVLVRGFYDCNGDGTGDLRGLTEKLDYLEWLGVDCLWLLPFYQSPLRDGGYDVSDFLTVLPEYGDRRRRRRVHRGGPPPGHPGHLRHGREPHVRPAPVVPGVTPGPHEPQGRLVRVERRRPPLVRGPHHLHRHRALELDLGPPARAVLLAPVLPPPARPQLRQPRGRGGAARRRALLDGPRASTASASTPCPTSTSATAPTARTCPRPTRCLQRMRKTVDAEFPGKRPARRGEPVAGRRRRLLRADGDECQMNFHFPLMPRMFMAVRREQRFPITEILAQTPPIPDNCQWGIFLRNHDELTLEMVTDEERDYMYSEYAAGSPHEDQRRHPAPALPAARQRPPQGRAVPRRCCTRCRAARSCTTATRSGWATTSTSATATASARRCSGRPTATPGSPRPTPPVSTCRRSWIRSTATRRSTSRPSSSDQLLVPALGPAHARRAARVPGVRHRPTSRCSTPRTRRCSPTSAPPGHGRRTTTPRALRAQPVAVPPAMSS